MDPDENRPRHPALSPFVDRRQEFQDYALAMYELKGGELEDLAERLGTSVDLLESRRSAAEYHDVQARVFQAQMAASICRVKVQERAVELVEAMLRVALTPGKDQAKMLLGLKEHALTTGLQRAAMGALDAHAAANSQLASTLSTHMRDLRELAPPAREIRTPILEGKAALPSAARVDDDG